MTNDQFPDGCTFNVADDFALDFCLPNGEHISGQATSQEEALAAVNDAHDKYILATWRHGKSGRSSFEHGGGTLICPLQATVAADLQS